MRWEEIGVGPVQGCPTRSVLRREASVLRRMGVGPVQGYPTRSVLRREASVLRRMGVGPHAH